MSEPRLISPMLDDFDMGGPISEHDGVRCCPAMRKNSDEKYIVKIISVPASQTKLDALLLTGAYTDISSALAYFKAQANGIEDEKKLLDSLAKLEGFVSYESCQIIPMDDATGYDVYLLSKYRKTLERQNSKAPMTQLAAVNLGLDLCAALAVCRRSGYLCVDLKPSNIFITGDKEYKIGDLGFVRLSSLKYASLPDKYRSLYTAPELEDAFAALNETMDIYAVGLILYQVFNGGDLPFSGNTAPSEKLDAPVYADEEIAQIILKACDPDPAERWQDPVQMGQALVNYMQKNSVNDTPLTAEYFGTKEDIAEAAANAVAEEFTDLEIAESDETDTAVEEAVVQNEVEEQIQDIDDASEVDDGDGDDDDDDVDIAALISLIDDATEDEEALSDEISSADGEVDDIAATEEAESDVEIMNEDPCEDQESMTELADDTQVSFIEEEYDNLSFLDDWDEESEKLLADIGDDYDGVTDEVSAILGQIDSLAAHQVPDPVVAPDPIEIVIPDPIVIEDEAERLETDDVLLTEDESVADDIDEVISEEEQPYIPKKKRTGLVWCIVLLVLLGLAVGGYFFYTQYYLQPIHSLTLSGSEDKLHVQLAADIDESILTIVCADAHGNKVTAPVSGGTAVFSGLAPDAAYTVTVEVDGFHKLTGMVSKVYSTPLQTKVTQMRAITGSESGSVILNFAVEGPDSEQWNVIYSAEGEAERITAFPSHMVTLAGLTVGKEYAFRLEPVDDIYITGETEITYFAKNLVVAENLHIVACVDGELTAQWDTPAGETVSKWSIRCYNESGFDQTINTAENTVTFQDIDDTLAYTVEVTAAEMSVNQRVSVAENSITVRDFSVNTSNSDYLTLAWTTNREIPAGGWTIRYTVNDLNATEMLTAKENAVKVPVVPNGNYVFSILDDAGNAVLGGPFTHVQSGASTFEAYDISQNDITARLCRTPSSSAWSYSDLKDEDYVNSFSIGDKISMVLASSGNADDSDDNVLITFTIYNENGDLVSFSHDTQPWDTMWYQNYCELDIPCVLTDAGTYNVIVYFNGAEVGSQKFEIAI